LEPHEYDEKLCKIIAYAGDSKSAAVEAMEAGRSFQFERAAELMAQSDESLLISQKVQLELMTSEARGESVQVSMLLMHAVSIFSAAETANLFAKQYIDLCKVVKNQS
jgi:PTS system cellobiose-specific IIA component